MNVLVRKMNSLGLLKVEMILGLIVMVGAVILLPVGIMSVDITLMANPYVFGVIAIGMLMFASVGFFRFVYPYIIYSKLPAVQAETDGEFLYIHTKKEAKIPVTDLCEATVYVHLPFIYQKEFLSDIIIHMFSEEYGKVILEVPGYGTYKMRFVSHATKTGDDLIRFIRESNNIE